MNPNTRLENGTHLFWDVEFDGDGGLDWTRCKEYADPMSPNGARANPDLN